MDSFRLDCTTELKTHDEDLAKNLMVKFHSKEAHDLGYIISCDRTAGLAITLWVFKFIKGDK